MKLHKVSNWGLFNVMVVEWNEGVAYRLGVGRVFKESLAKSFSPGETWKTITLAQGSLLKITIVPKNYSQSKHDWL
jgi:hypothetical protein